MEELKDCKSNGWPEFRKYSPAAAGFMGRYLPHNRTQWIEEAKDIVDDQMDKDGRLDDFRVYMTRFLSTWALSDSEGRSLRLPVIGTREISVRRNYKENKKYIIYILE